MPKTPKTPAARRTKRYVCRHCNTRKAPTLFPRDNDEECTDCLAKAQADRDNEAVAAQVEAPEATGGELFHSPNIVETMNPGAQAEMAARVLARRRLLAFIKRFKPKYMAGWVHEDICRRLERFVEQVEQGLEPRLLLMMPVRHGKSEIASRHFAPWVLGKHPEWEIIAASGAQSLALSFSRYIRDLVRDPAYQSVFPSMRLDPGSQSVENWNTTSGGGYLAAGIGTMITGRGAHILLIDDPVKDAEAADSQVIRDATWEWYMSTAYTRLAPGGGVLGIMCMTGDTPVLMSDGTQRRLDSLRAGDEIATYIRGVLGRTTVGAMRSSGRDSLLKITTSSGRIVRANQRHPFLVVAPNGELSWVRAQHLTTASRIVALKGSGVNGEVLRALPRGATRLPSVEDFAQVTMGSKSGPAGTELRPRLQRRVETPASNTATVSTELSTTPCTSGKVGAVPSAANTPSTDAALGTGRTSSPSTTATTQGESEDCSATTATQESGTLLLSQWHLPPLSTSDFTLEAVVSVTPDGVEEVFDVQVADTENFIANGLVSHNTWWNEDDWAGRIQQVMNTGDGDKFEIVKYPAINEHGDEYILPDDTITEVREGEVVPEGATLTRAKNSALHPARYTLDMLLSRKRNYYALGQQRWWAALYQQNPTPDEGVFFTKDMFVKYQHAPTREGRRVYQAWDFAITEKQKSDWTVGVTMLVDEHDTGYVLDVWRFRTENGLALAEAIVRYAIQWGADLVGVEDGQIWKAIKASFEKACRELKHYPSYEVLQTLTDKRTRAQPARGRMQQHKILFPGNAPWYSDFEHELLRFEAGGRHDDQVDGLAHVVRLSLAQAKPSGPRARANKLKSWKHKLGLLLPGGAGGHMAA